MNVNGVAPPPVVYIPTQVIAPSVPNTQPIGLPTADRKADPTPLGTPFVKPEDTERAVRTGRDSAPLLAKPKMVEVSAERSSLVAPRAEPKAAVARSSPIAAAARPGAFDKYA